MRLLCSLLTIASLAGCVDFSPATGGSKSPSSAKTSLDPTAPDCPDAPKCLTDRECSYDDARQCMVCRCASPFGPPPTVTGVPPIQ